MRHLASALLTLAIVACPVLCGTCWEVLGLKHAAVLGEEDGDHSPLTPANDGDDCLCKCKGAVAIGSGDQVAAILGDLGPTAPIDPFEDSGIFPGYAAIPSTGGESRFRPGGMRVAASPRALLRIDRC